MTTRSINMSTPLYRDPNASVEDQVENVLALMTLDEKLAQLVCIWSSAFVSTGTFDPNVVTGMMPHGIGQITRIGASTGLHPEESAALMNAIQQVAIEHTRLGIPVIVHEESTGGFCHRDATVFPQGIGLAATWDPDLVQQVAEVIRTQMVAVGARHALAPVLDIARDPRWGRVEETYGEDPVLGGHRDRLCPGSPGRRSAPGSGRHGQALPWLRHVGGRAQLGSGSDGSTRAA